MDSSWEAILETLPVWTVNVQWLSHWSQAGVRNLHVRMMEATTRNNAREGNVIVLIGDCNVDFCIFCVNLSVPAMEDSAVKRCQRLTILIVKMLEMSIIQIKLQNFVILALKQLQHLLLQLKQQQLHELIDILFEYCTRVYIHNM